MRHCTLLALIIICAALSGCDAIKGKYTKAQIETEIASRLQYSDVKLTDRGDGKFTGTGKKGNEVHQIEVIVQNKNLTWKHSYTNPDGSGASSGSGNITFDQ